MLRDLAANGCGSHRRMHRMGAGRLTRCTVDCPARGNCFDELQAECCAVFRANSNAGAVRIDKAAQCREREARKKDAAKPIPEAAYMQRVKAIAETMPP